MDWGKLFRTKKGAAKRAEQDQRLRDAIIPERATPMTEQRRVRLERGERVTPRYPSGVHVRPGRASRPLQTGSLFDDVERLIDQHIDPFDPHGDGTLRPGDLMYEIFNRSLETGKPMHGEIVQGPDGEWREVRRG